MYVLLVILVTFFIVAISSWWLDDFAEATDEPLTARNAAPVAVPQEQPITQQMPATAGD